ncbi:MAG: hypothetical protein Q8P34_01400 [Bacteroidota bacterium]|nr:hypothetical protein [Bacteroidota bacterium]
MKIRKTFIITLLIVSATFGSLNTMAQKETTRIKQEVEVVKAYQPTISEVEKINDIPKIKTEQTEAPVFDYSIFSKPVFSTFDITPVAAAKMFGEPKPEMEMGLLKLGFGNYMTPYGELFFNSQPDKNSNFGMHFKHLSSYGKIGLLNGDIVKAPQSENIAEIFGEKFWRKSTLSGSLAFDRKSFNYYGYTGDILSDELKDEMIPYYQDKQYFSKGTAKVGLKGENISPLDFNYDFGLKYHYFKTKTGQTENQTVFSGDMSKKYGQTFGLLNTSLTYYLADGVMNNFSNSIGSKQQILIRVNPSVMWKTEGAKLQAGVNSTIVFDDDTDASMLIWPKVKAEWSPVPKILTIFAGVDGHLQHNTYSNIAAENPYADPFHDVLNTNYKYIVSGGLKGKFSSKTNYVAEASYSKVKDQHFYMLYGRDVLNLSAIGPRSLNNTFDWVYDDLKVLKLSAEVMHSVSENFSLRLLGNYYSYELETIDEAWQMPDFDVTFSGIYKPTEQLKFTTDIFVVGKRTALVSEQLSSSAPSLIVEMDPIIDLNVGGEYQFNKSLNFFVRLNNFGFQKYEQWLGYTNKSFNWMAGMSYTF